MKQETNTFSRSAVVLARLVTRLSPAFRRVALMLLLAVMTTTTTKATNLTSGIDYCGTSVGCIFLSGWVFDPEVPHWDLGNQMTIKIEVGTHPDNQDDNFQGIYNDADEYLERDDINSQYHISGKHGFRARVEGIGPMLFEEETEKTLYVNIYAIANFGNGQEEILLNKTPYVLNVRNDLAYDANEDIYYLCNADEWDAVATAMEDDQCNGVVGNYFSSCNYKLDENFDNSTPVTEVFGKSTRPFTGTFDGNGQTINVQLSGTEHVAPFAYTDGVTIQNLVVAGTINATQSAGGIVGYAANTLTIENCVSGATISGFSQFAGGLLGWCDDLTLTMGNCLFKGAFSPADGGKYHLFACKAASKTVTMSSANGLYYVNTLAPSEGLGKNCIAKTEGTPVSATLIKGVWDNPFVAADGQPYYRIHVKGSEENPNLIYDADHWNNIAEAIADDFLSQDFSDCSYRLADNFDNSTAVTTMFGTATHPFTGIFDGNGQTLNVNLSGTEHVAPFAYTDGATIQNLTVAGIINATQSAGGIVGYAANSLTIENSVCAATINGFSQFAGGMLGWCDDLTLTMGNCLFKGAFSPADGGKYQPIACKDATKTVTMPPVIDLYYLNTAAPSEGLGDNCIPRAKGTPVSATLDDGVWDDPLVAADGITYYGVHFNGKHLPYEYGFETPLDEEGWMMADCIDRTGLREFNHSGNYSFYFLWTSNQSEQHYQYLISPKLDNRSGIKMTFYYIINTLTAGSATFQVGYSTTTPDIDAFNWDNGTTTSNKQWLLYERSFPKGTRYIAIKWHPNNYGYLYLDDFSFMVCNAPSPTHLNAIDITEYTASPTWEAPEADETITGYAYQYKKASDTDWSAETTVDATSVTLTGLTANSDYQFRVKALYGEDESFYVPIYFTTAMELPYDYGFENGMNRWSRVDDALGRTGISEEAKHEGEKGYCFKNSLTSSPQYLISPRFASNRGLAVLFYYRTDNIVSNETFHVGYSTSTNDVDAFIWGDEISVKCDHYLVPKGDDVWVYVPIVSWSLYENVFPAGTKYIAVKYTSNVSSLLLDDFTFLPFVGPKPEDLAVQNCTDQTVTLTWTAPQTSNGITGYAYQYKKASDEAWSAEVTTTATTATISGMTASTDYEFRIKTLYGSDASLYSRLNFTTALELPYDYGFENGMNRWSRVDDAWGRTGISEEAKHEGEKGYCFKNSLTSSPQYLISPRFASDRELAVLFYYRTDNIASNETFHVGYSTSTNDVDAFTWGDEISVKCKHILPPGGGVAIRIVEWSLYENVFPAGTKYIAVKYTSNVSSLFLDDFTFQAYVGPKPEDLAVQNCTDQTTTLTWTAPQTNDGIMGYAYQYKKASDEAWSAEVTTTATTATISGMTAGTDYEFRVKTLYGSDASLYSRLNFTSAVALPYSYGFEDGLGGWTETDCYIYATEAIYTDHYTGICSEFHHSGDHAFAFCPWTDDTQYLISPRLSDDSPIMLSFFYRHGYYWDGISSFAKFQVGYSQTTSDISAFTWSTVVISDEDWNRDPYIFPAGTKFIAIKWRPNSNYLYLDDFRIREYVNISLAENADNITTITSNKGEDAIATLQDRTLHRDGLWQTLCLPFDISNFTGTPLAGATVKTLGSSSFSNGTLTLNFEDATSIEAGKPYIVNWEKAAYLIIYTTEDWDAFAESVNSGKSYAGKTVMLGADINVSTMVGTAEHPFDGIIEGNHKRLTIDISNGGNGAAPFRYIKDATIKNLPTTGSVSGGNYSAGLVGFASGTNTIHNCLVETDVTVSTGGGGYVGGILGNGTSSTTTIRDCAYNGYLHGLNFGMIYGWGEAGGTHTIENCMSSGYCYLQEGSVADLMLVAPGATCNVINCYKYQNVGTQGTYCDYMDDESPLAEQLGDQWTTNNNGELAIQLSEIITVAYTNLVNPEFIGFNISDATANVGTDYADFLGSCSPFASTEGLLFDEYNPNNGACRGALRLANLNDAAFDGWYTDAELTTPVTTIPFAADGTVTLYTKATKPLVPGDVNNDGKVTPADAIMILYHYFGVVQNDFNKFAADVNHDTKITPADAIEALYKYFGASAGARSTKPANSRDPE